MADEAVHKQLSTVCGAQNGGHVVLTVATGQVAPAAGVADVLPERRHVSLGRE